MTATAIRRTALLLALTAALLVAALVLIGLGRAGADDGDGLPAPTGLRVAAERGSLDVSLDWDDVSGAAHYRVRWRPAGPDNKLNDGVQVRSSSAVITVARYGEWVARVQACDDAGCGAPVAKKFRVRKPRAVPDITPLPTSTPTPLPTPTPTPEPTATPTPLPTATPTPEPTATSTPLPTATPVPGTLHVSVSASSATLPVNRPVSLTAAVSNAPAGSDPSYAWELRNGGDWSSHGTGHTLSYLAGRPESWSFRVTVTYDSGVSATSGALTVTWVEVPPTPTATSIPEPKSTPTPLPAATPIPEPTATPTSEPAVPIPDEPAGLSVSATPGSLEVSVDWDDVPGASYYWVRWRVSGSGSELNEGVAVLPSEAVIAVSDYGEWVVRAQACNDAGCGAPAVSRFSVDAAPVTPGRPDNLEVIAGPSNLSLWATWDNLEGATSYKLRWRRDGGEFETDNAATVSDAMWAVTVPDYGRWEVRVQGCNDSGCGNEAAATAEVLRAASLSLERAVDSEGNVRSRTLSASWDPVEGASSYTLSWQRLGDDSQANTQAQAQSASNARQARSASVVSVKSADTRTTNQLTLSVEETGADFTVPDNGAYRAEFRALNDDGELIALASSHVNQAPGQPDTTPPWLEWGEIDGTVITLHFSEPLDENATGGHFETDINIWSNTWMSDQSSNIEISGSKVTVRGNLRAKTVSTPFRSWNAFVQYHPPASGTGGLRDLAGNPLMTLSTRYYLIPIQNVTGTPYVTGIAVSSDPGEDGSYASGDAIKVKLTFRKDVNVTGIPRLKIDLDPAAGAGEKWASYVSGSGTRMLEFAYTAASADLSAAGVAVIENSLELNGGAIRGAPPAPGNNARLAHLGLHHNPSHRVVTPTSAAPILQSATVTGTALTLTFSEPLGAAASLANGAFTVKKTPQDGTEQTVSLGGSPSISGSTVTLTLASAVLATDAGVKVSYAKPATGTNNKLVDADGAEAADFTDEWVVNTLDTTKPELLRGEIDGDVMTLYFSEPLDEHSGGDGGYYRVGLTLDSFQDRRPYGGDKCVRMYSWGISLTARPEKILINDNTVTLLRLGHGYQHERLRGRVREDGSAHKVRAFYVWSTDPTANILRDLSGNTVSASDNYYYDNGILFQRTSDLMFLNNVTRLPYPKSATVNGNRLTLTFNAPMDGAPKPAASAFTVKVNGSAVNLAGSNPVAVSGREVTLTLAAAVVASDTVTVSYDKPDSSPLRNIVCESAPSFTDQPVTNSTP